MIALRNVTKTLLTNPNRFSVSDKFMKERDQAAEKIYITTQEKQSMKMLLEKLSKEKQQSTTKQGQFQRRLDAILKRYKITNTSFATEVINLHKQF